MRRWVLGLLLLALPGTSAGQYISRPCGFDLDDDFVVGEPADCDVCDGITADPDGDGVDEDLNYVDCDAGTNTGACGSPGAPCGTIQWVLDGSNGLFARRFNGPGDGAEDIACFRGRCNERLNMRQSGLATVKTKPRASSEVRPFSFPSNPSMLVGWDSDNDGQYPPFDPDDTALLDGDDNENSSCDVGERCTGLQAIRDDAAADAIEYAHFTVANWGHRGTTSVPASGFLRLADGSGRRDLHYLHDLVLDNICGGRSSFTPENNAGCRTIWWSTSGGQLTNIALMNLHWKNWGAYGNRGGAGTALESGPYRFQNITAEGLGRSGGNIKWMEVWEFHTGIEILDSIIDSRCDLWGCSMDGSSNVDAVDIAQCTRDWDIVNTTFKDWRTHVLLQVNEGAGGCSARNINRVHLDRVRMRNETAQPAGAAGGFVRFARGGGRTVERLRVTNSFFSSRQRFSAVLHLSLGSADAVVNIAAPWTTPCGTDGACGGLAGSCDMALGRCRGGLVEFVHNTIDSPFDNLGDQAGSGAVAILGSGQAFNLQNYDIRNNIVGGTVASDPVILETSFAPTRFRSDANAFASVGRFIWAGAASVDLPGWRALSGQDAASAACTASFVDAATGDYHLAGADTCAFGRAADSMAVTTVDIDGEPRSAAGDDIGADRRRPATATPTTTSPPTTVTPTSTLPPPTTVTSSPPSTIPSTTSTVTSTTAIPVASTTVTTLVCADLPVEIADWGGVRIDPGTPRIPPGTPHCRLLIMRDLRP